MLHFILDKFGYVRRADYNTLMKQAEHWQAEAAKYRVLYGKLCRPRDAKTGKFVRNK